MRATHLLALFAIVFGVSAIPIHVFPAPHPDGVNLVLIGTPPPRIREAMEAEAAKRQMEENEQDAIQYPESSDAQEEWNAIKGYTEQAMGKRSIALGRSGFRPGKRSNSNTAVVPMDTEKFNALYMKRSMAIGRLGLRPGKRSISFGRLNFRPGKRSAPYGRQGKGAEDQDDQTNDYLMY